MDDPQRDGPGDRQQGPVDDPQRDGPGDRQQGPVDDPQRDGPGDRQQGPVGDLPAGLDGALALRDSMGEQQRARVEARVSALLDLLGKAHTMAVLRTFAFAAEPLRFSELEDRLDVSPNTLSARLSELVDAGLLVRRSYDEVPPRVEYRPTAKAEALFPAFGHFHRWAVEHDLEPADDAVTSETEAG